MATRSEGRMACSSTHRLQKVTLIAMFNEGSTTRRFFENMPDANWVIISFSPISRIACIKILSTLDKTISVTLPVLSVSGIKD